MRFSIAAMALASLVACAAPPEWHRTAALRSVSLECGDGYQVNVDEKAMNVLVIAYPLSSAVYTVCTRGAGRAREERAALAAIKHLRLTRRACVAGAVTSAGAAAYLVAYSDCRPMAPDERA